MYFSVCCSVGVCVSALGVISAGAVHSVCLSVVGVVVGVVGVSSAVEYVGNSAGAIHSVLLVVLECSVFSSKSVCLRCRRLPLFVLLLLLSMRVCHACRRFCLLIPQLVAVIF